jgi:hypothetical protein
MMKKIGEMIFNDLPTEVMVAKAIKPRYIYEYSKLPKKYNNIYYDFIDGILCNNQTNEPVITNAEDVGKPRMTPINGQSLHMLLYSADPVAKSKVHKIKTLLKDYFLKNLQYLEITQIPIHIEMKFYVNRKHAPDMDNLKLFYEKLFLDCIQVEVFTGRGKKEINSKGIIINDDIDHINGTTIKAFFTNRSPYLKINFYVYEDTQEFINDRANLNITNEGIVLEQGIIELAEKYAMMAVRRKFKENEIYDQSGELAKRPAFLFNQEKEFHLRTIKNTLIK